MTKDQVIESMAEEVKIVQHLFTKIPEGTLDFRPAEGMRSTLELLRYLTYAARFPTHGMVHDDWQTARRFIEEAKEMAAEDFPARMDAQLDGLRGDLASVSEGDLSARTVTFPWGGEALLGAALVDVPLKFLTAYRMQLFVYAKASGASTLNTYNAWMGADAPAGG